MQGKWQVSTSLWGPLSGLEQGLACCPPALFLRPQISLFMLDICSLGTLCIQPMLLPYGSSLSSSFLPSPLPRIICVPKRISLWEKKASAPHSLGHKGQSILHIYTNNLILRSALLGRRGHYPHFTDGENEAERTSIPSRVVHARKWQNWALNPGRQVLDATLLIDHYTFLPFAGPMSPAGDIRVRTR